MCPYVHCRVKFLCFNMLNLRFIFKRERERVAYVLGWLSLTTITNDKL